MLKNNRYFAYILLASSLVIACSSSEQSPPRIPESKLKVDLVHSISGEDLLENHGIFFGMVGSFHVDKECNLLIVNDDKDAIVAFDKNGNFKFSFGKRGRGPGEFGTILGLSALNDGSYHVYDLTQMRTVIFSNSGEFISQHLVPKGVEIRGNMIHYKDDYLYSSVGLFNSNPEANLIKIVAKNTYEIVREFLPVSSFVKDDEFSFPLSSTARKRFVLLNDSTLMYAIGHYYGEVYKIHFGSEPVRVESIDGYRFIETPYLATKNQTEAKFKGYNTYTSTFNGTVMYHSISRTLELEQQANGTIYHLSAYKESTFEFRPHSLVLEEFSPDGTLLRWGMVTDVPHLDNPSFSVRALSKDGKVYIWNSDNSTIWVYQFQWED